ncbi:MAG: PAC2 family protein [candidate division WS1 bacterium]|jgi:hypothetical protein|nr:PAC2 family protein [candidate division WS1 bacterium]
MNRDTDANMQRATELIIDEWPEVERPTLVIGLSGWMDGGMVSTATLGYLRERLAATNIAEIDPMDFYIYHFPAAGTPITVQFDDGHTIVHPLNPMDYAAAFRPHVTIEDGLITSLDYPANYFWAAPEAGLILFSGEEPHIRWGAWCDCIFALCDELEITDIYFVGSVASPIPHTREPRVRVSVADEKLLGEIDGVELLPTTYAGPSSVITALSYHSVELGIALRSLVVEIPHYPFLEIVTYPRSIRRMVATLDRILGIGLDLSDLDASVELADMKLKEAVASSEEFAALVRKLEEAYDVEEEAAADEDLLRRLIDTVDIEGEND